MINPESTEALIVTTAIRNVSEMRGGMLWTPKGIDKDDFMINVIKNIKSNTQIKSFTIVHDFKIDSLHSYNYQKKLCNIKGINLIVSTSSLGMPSQLTASLAFKLGLSYLSKDYLLFWEHDHLFTEKVDWNIVENCFKEDGKMLRFNRHINKKNSYYYLNEKTKQYPKNCDFDKNLLYFPYYDNGPFVAQKKYCENLWNEVNFEIPNWNGYFGGFIEGPVQQKIYQDQFNLGISDFEKKYPLYLYGGLIRRPIVAHFGNHKAIYKNKFYEILDKLNFFHPLRKLKSFVSNKIHTLLFETSK